MDSYNANLWMFTVSHLLCCVERTYTNYYLHPKEDDAVYPMKASEFATPSCVRARLQGLVGLHGFLRDVLPWQMESVIDIAAILCLTKVSFAKLPVSCCPSETAFLCVLLAF